VAAASLGTDAAAVFYVDQYIPTYYEIGAQVMTQAPTGGWKANAYVIFDYFSPTDFKFAGIDVALNKAVLGHRTAAGWIIDAQGSVPGSVKSNTWYDLLVTVNGLIVTVLINGASQLQAQYDPRYIDGKAYGLNMGYVGVGSNNSQGSFDNISVKELPPQSSFANNEDYSDGVADLFTGDRSGTWTISSGRYAGTPSAIAPAVNVLKMPVSVTADAYVELESQITLSGVAGLVFDYYSTDDYKYATLDTSTGTLTIGHHKRNRNVADFTTTVTIPAGTDQRFELTLRGLTVNALLNGVTVATFSFNGDVVDGGLGLIVRTGSASYDNTRVLVGTQVVNAVDAIPPTLTVPPNVTRSEDPGKTTAFVSDATIGTATATDNVPGVTVTRSGVPAGNIFPFGVTTITWTALDVFGNQTVKTQTVTVFDGIKPTIVVPPNVTVSLSAGQSSIVVSDAQLGTATASDNSGTVTLTRSGVPAGNVFGPGTTTITYTAVDPSGNTTVATQTVTVMYPTLVLTVAGNQTSTEGASTTFNLGTASGGGGWWRVTVNWGDGQTSTLATAPGPMTGTHVYRDNGSYTVGVTLTDADGQSKSGSFTITVANVAPVVRINTPGPGSNLARNTTYAFKASFTDPGTADTHTCTITWGDGSSSTGTVSESGGAGTCLSSHAYKSTGNYTITVKVTDNAGASSTATSAITVTQNGGTVYTLLAAKAKPAKKATAKPAKKPAKKSAIKPAKKPVAKRHAVAHFGAHAV
jgi:hypothetical protein